MPHSRLRQATLRDSAALLAVHKASVASLCSKDYSPEHIEAWFEDRTEDIYRPAIQAGQVWLCEDGEGVLGFVGFAPGEVTLLFVAPAAAGKGLGSKLFEFALACAEEHDDRPVVVVATKNSVPFYGRYGFEPVENQAFVRGSHKLSYPVVKMRRDRVQYNEHASTASAA